MIRYIVTKWYFVLTTLGKHFASICLSVSPTVELGEGLYDLGIPRLLVEGLK